MSNHKGLSALEPAAPEGQQPVAWASVKDHLPEVGSKFVLLYDDGSGASLYFRHDSGYIDADGDECDALDENRMWAYLPAGFEFWCEGACEPITLPKWKGHSNPRPSEQAVTEARTVRREIKSEMEILRRLADGDQIAFSEDGDCAFFTGGDRAFVGPVILSMRSKSYLKRIMLNDENYRGTAERDVISDTGMIALKAAMEAGSRQALASKGEER